jgi:multimeric flavodoxin WrbA
MKVLVLSASPRRDGNSRVLAEALREGAESAGHESEVVDLNEVIHGLLRDCRRCRLPDGRCSIEDGYEELMHGRVLPADGLVYATPLYWYGMAAALKNYFDRMVCYISASYPHYETVAHNMVGKRAALLLSSEERYPGASLGVIAQIQELSRYLHHEFVGVVNGVGNRRGEVRLDPSDPIAAARVLGGQLFQVHHSDYRLDTERPNTVWENDTGTQGSSGVYEDV